MIAVVVPILSGCVDAGPTDTLDDPVVDTAQRVRPPPVDPGPTGAVGGTVRDVLGGPLSGVKVAMCAQVCITTDTGPDGSFLIEALPILPHAFHVRVVQEEGFASPMVPVEVYEGERRRFDVVVPPMPAAVELPATSAEVEPTAGLYVTAHEGSARSTFGEPVTDLAALQLPPERFPPLEGLTGTVRAVYYLAPYDADADPPWPFRVDDAWGIGDGGSLRAWVAGYGEQRWIDAGALTASPEGTLDGGALPMLTTLVLVEP